MMLDSDTPEIRHGTLESHVGALIDICEKYSSEQESARKRALEYYDGVMRDLTPDPDFSKVISKDVRKTIKRLMPSVMRTLLNNDKMVQYDPVGDGDEETARQATKYVNHVVIPASGAEEAIYDAIFDAALLKTGILKWTAYRRKDVVIQEYSGQPESSMTGLDSEAGIELFSVKENVKPSPDGQGTVSTWDFKIRFYKEETDIRLEAVPRGSFLIHPRSEGVEDSPVVGERQTLTRSELVRRGYDKDVISGLSASTRSKDTEDLERRGADFDPHEDLLSRSMEEIDVYEVYVRIDLDGDGIAELHRIVYTPNGGENKKTILEREIVTEAPYAKVVIEREAHHFEGHSIAEDVVDIQRAKTSLLRTACDNLYWSNNPMTFADLSAVENPLDLYTPKLGKPILIKSGRNANEAIQTVVFPVTADTSFRALDVFNREGVETTGIDDASGGLDAESIQNVAATTANILNDKGVSQAEMIIRSVARGGLRKAFRGILKLVIAHSDEEKRVRIRDTWESFDPRVWNVDMDCTVNTGLGAGSRERDLAVLQLILNLQREVLSSHEAGKFFVKPNQIYNTLARMTEACGFGSPEPYFTEPDPEELRQVLETETPSPEEMKIQASAELEKAKSAARIQIEQAQMEADLRVKAAEQEKDAYIETLKSDYRREADSMRNQIDLLKHTQKMQLEWAKAGLDSPEPLVPPDIPTGTTT